MNQDTFFRKLGDDRFEATQWTRGPWSPVEQHAGPPSALLAGRLEEMAGDSFRVARVAIEVTRPVPIGTLRLERSLLSSSTSRPSARRWTSHRPLTAPSFSFLFRIRIQDTRLRWSFDSVGVDLETAT